MPRSRTSPPASGRFIILYDGRCGLCTAGSKRLLRLARPSTIERRDFRAPGALDDFPGLSYKACDRAMHLIAPDGRIYTGAAAIARALRTRPILGLPFALYHLPGIRWVSDRIYTYVSARRSTLSARLCKDGSCTLHTRPPG